MTNIAFIFIVLPIAVIAHVLTPVKYRNITLLFINSAVYILIFRKSVLILALFVVIDFFSGVLISRTRKLWIKFSTAAVIILKNTVGISVLIYIEGTTNYLVPIGFLVYAFTTTGYIIDAYNGKEAAHNRNIGDFCLFSTLFFKAQAGPVVRWSEFRSELYGKNVTLLNIWEGFKLFSTGLFKKIFIADSAIWCYRSVYESAISGGFSEAWCAVVFFIAGNFFMLSGYSDMARGIGRMFGMELPENFEKPFSSGNMRDFLGRYNKSVSDFNENYLTACLKSSEVSVRNVIKTFAVWLAACFFWSEWFGIFESSVVFLIYLTAVIVAERFWLEKKISKLPVRLAKIITGAGWFIGFAFLSGKSFTGIKNLFLSMAGFGKSFAGDEIKRIFLGSWIVPIVIGAVAGWYLLNKLGEKSKSAQNTVKTVICIAMFAVSVIYMI